MTTESALQAALAAEHAAVWVYAVLGGQTSQSASPQLFADVVAGYSRHRDQRDRLTAIVRDRGDEPVASEPGYVVPDRLGSPAAVSAQALAIERGCAAAYASLVAESSGQLRALAVDALGEAAVRELTFRGIPENFPGARELANR